MLMVLIVLAFITGWTFVYGTYYILAYDRLLMEKRLKMIKTQSTLKVHRNEELQRPFMDRAVRP